MAHYQYGSTSRAPPPRLGKTEFEILKASHKFLRGEDDEKSLSWDEQLAAKYYASLYREFAVCDLKHYKSGNFALRWRTEDEVLSGAGETTCGNTRCVHHHIPDHIQHANTHGIPALTTLELPFAYVEQGENKSALVKVVLCPKCFDKLMWKRRKQKEKQKEMERVELQGDEGAPDSSSKDEAVREGYVEKVKAEDVDVEIGSGDGSGSGSGNGGRERRGKHRGSGDEENERRRRRRSSRSRSPRPRHPPRRRSPVPPTS